MASLVLRTPISEQEVRNLKLGEILYLDGEIIAARDRAHQRLFEFAMAGKTAPFDLKSSTIYHCGPLAKKVRNKWEILAAGPTTSARMERFQAEIIRRFGVRMVIGKGGMGPSTAKAMSEFGAVYCAIPGGAGALIAKSIRRIVRVEWLDLGIAEAIWLLEVEKIGPLVVAIDAHGNNLYNTILSRINRI